MEAAHAWQGRQNAGSKVYIPAQHVSLTLQAEGSEMLLWLLMQATLACYALLAVAGHRVIGLDAETVLQVTVRSRSHHVMLT